MPGDVIAARYVTAGKQHQRPWRESLVLVGYHLRLLNWWLLLLVALGFLASGFLIWLPFHAGSAQGQVQAAELSRFVLEPGAGMLAALLASVLVVGDPLLEVTMATPATLTQPLFWRALLTFLLLLCCSAAFLAWTLLLGVGYMRQQNPLALTLVWLAPVLVMGLLGLLGALITRNAALGLVIAAIPLAGSLFLYPKLVTIPATHPYLITYTASGGQDARDWWVNRVALLGIALVLAVVNWLLLRREERLLGSGE